MLNNILHLYCQPLERIMFVKNCLITTYLCHSVLHKWPYEDEPISYETETEHSHLSSFIFKSKLLYEYYIMYVLLNLLF